MDILRSLIVIVVFLVMWKEASNQEIKSRKDLNERIKRYHESDRNGHTKRREQAKVGREKKNILTVPVNPKTQNGPYIAIKSNKVISPRQLVRSKSASNSKTIRNIRKPYVMHVPEYSFENKSIDDQDKLNETLVNNETIVVQEKKIVIDENNELKEDEHIDTVNIEKIHVSNDTDLLKTQEKPIADLIVKRQEFEETKLKLKNKHHKTKKTFDLEIDDNISNKTVLPDLIKDKGQQDKLNDIPTAESIISPEKTKDEIKCENRNKLDETETVKIIENDEIDKSTETKKEVVISKQDGETQPKGHPVLDVIQNNRSINSPLDTVSAPILTEVKETKNNVNKADINIEKGAEILKKASTNGSKNEVDITQDNDDNAEIIIKKNNFEEVMEVTPPIAPIGYQSIKSQNRIAPAFYKNYYQTPNQPRAQIGMNSNYYNPNNHAPDEQRTVQIDGSTVVSYKNYFKLPSYNPNIRNGYPLSSYGYSNPTSQNRNYWRHGGYWQTNGNTNERIWRTWKNTEYYLKSKNALKKIDSEQLNNLINQNNFSDKAKLKEMQ